MTLSSPSFPSSSSRAAPLGWEGKGWDDGDGDEREILRVEARGGRTLFISHSLSRWRQLVRVLLDLQVSSTAAARAEVMAVMAAKRTFYFGRSSPPKTM